MSHKTKVTRGLITRLMTSVSGDERSHHLSRHFLFYSLTVDGVSVTLN